MLSKRNNLKLSSNQVSCVPTNPWGAVNINWENFNDYYIIRNILLQLFNYVEIIRVNITINFVKVMEMT